ncbi:ABC-2 type transporter [Exiguobacterium sp. 8H]|uniref:ABC transporter permease n=1 Tax=unclassified Exiguobacterium TaxID=2644629 RepID=UPI0012F0E3DB|nr:MULTISPECIES: ABC transporter permease [unclassified Exiguobacterium]VXB54925.1 ABC-2 type transporter [Exiguobacterium sp. 8A]VXB55742.1 ABC-2 type transporter [Exiguobacterium sp. 8H]
MVLIRHVAKRMLRKKGLWVFTFVSMFGFALILSFVGGTSSLNASIGIVDRDGGLLAERLIDEAERFGRVTLLESNTDDVLLEGEDIVLIIPDDFTEQAFTGEMPRLSFSAIAGSDASLIEQALNGHLSRERQLLEASGYDRATFEQLASKETSNGYSLSSEPFQESVATTARTQAFFGLLSFIMMSTFLQFIPMFVADDRDEKIYARLFASPVTPRRYFASLLLAFYLVGFIYVMLLIGVSLALYGQDVWIHLPTVFALFSSYLLVCLALGGLIAVFATNREKANIFQISVTMASAITGGAFISLLWLPDSLKLVGRFLPTYWLNNGVITMYEGQFPYLSILVMIGMTGVVFLLTILVLKKRPLTV